MDDLRAAVRRVLLFHPQTVTNDAGAAPPLAGTARAAMPRAAEALVARLVAALSRGLRGGVGLWAVLEALDGVAGRAGRHAAARLKFARQLVYSVKSALGRSDPAVCARALIRLALSQGCLLAALELIARWYAEELLVFYEDPAVSVLCNGNGEMWDAFVSACAPIGGVTLAEIEAGVPLGTAVVKFDLKLVLSGVDGVEKGEIVDAIEGVRGQGVAVDEPVDPLCAESGGSGVRGNDLSGDSSDVLAQTDKQAPATVLNEVLVTPIPLSDGIRYKRKKPNVRRVKNTAVHKDPNTSSKSEQTSNVNLNHFGSEEKSGGDNGGERNEEEEEEQQQPQEAEEEEEKDKDNDEEETKKMNEDLAMNPMQLPEAPIEYIENSHNGNLNFDETNHSVDESGTAEAMLLLDKAEQVLWRRWKCVSSAMAAQETLLFAQLDELAEVSSS